MAANIGNIAKKIFKGEAKGTQMWTGGVGSFEKRAVGSVAERNALGIANPREAARLSRAGDARRVESAHAEALRQNRNANYRNEFDSLSPTERAGDIDNLHAKALDENSVHKFGDKQAALEARRQADNSMAQAQRDAESAASAASSPAPAPPSQRNAETVMQGRGKKFESISDFTSARANRQITGISNEIDPTVAAFNGGKLTDAQAKKMGFSGKADPGMNEDAIRAHFQGKIEGVRPDTTLGDKMAYHKVPQTAAAVGGTAWLVSKMSESKGQMSNSQLYGQNNQFGG